MFKKTKFINVFIISAGSIIIFLRIFNLFKGIAWSNFETVFLTVLFILSLYFSIRHAFRKRFRPIIILALFCVTALFLPNDYIYGLIDFKIKQRTREKLAQDFNKGENDILIRNNKHPEDGIRINNEKNHTIDVYKDSALGAIFFFQNFSNSEDYFGILYITDERYIRDKKIIFFLKREFDYKKLANNWYWLRCFADNEPRP